TTGIYPYSAMLSAFTPVDPSARTLKTSVSVQEWCGHVFTQLNLRGGAYRGVTYSYFESEADAAFDAGDALLEDEIWNRIRIAPKTLPIGELELIPSGFFSRFNHRQQRSEKAAARLEEAGNARIYIV